MSLILNDLKYNDSHEWVRVDADGQVTVGITDHAQEALGDVVFVELPTVGSELSTGASAGVVESVKAASDIYSPLDGVVTQINESLSLNPELVNSDTYGEGWMFRLQLSNPAQLDSMLDAAGYTQAIGG
ncbi:glycine cleavage system protein H [Aquaspirillum sp. LM1]|jgi:glycine cleavage system H protein|uniref:glycine cleavage system protein GcvH n=1 Tax=Aquaspirillum sp. LM1 TaxID=1938604 RepID=UPI000983D9D9|nr:glycine cleavage system protein GcvH [Aquaspirillum sp. LM1]AQR64302.1 glycine cleavage system protein H [Aquaspirillum sp. LM1]